MRWGRWVIRRWVRRVPPEIIGFDKAAEVVTAKYEGKGTLTMLLYPTPQIAGDHGRQIEAEMNRQGSSAGTVKLRREGPLVLMTTGAWKPAEAQEMVENIHLRNEVTWNKPVPPEFHSEVRKTVSLLTSILVFCGLGALAAVVLALFFGGATGCDSGDAGQTGGDRTGVSADRSERASGPDSAERIQGQTSRDRRICALGAVQRGS